MVNLGILFARIFGIPVHFVRVFPNATSVPEGLLLEGDSDVPSTVVPAWSPWANMLRNAFLAMFVWRTWSVLCLDGSTFGDAYLAFGENEGFQVILRPISTRYIAVRHGRESCRFAVVDGSGREIRTSVSFRGTKRGVRLFCQLWKADVTFM